MKSVPAERFGTDGRTIEVVTIYLSRHKDRVYLVAQGEKRALSYAMTREHWDQLVEEVDSPSADERFRAGKQS